MTNNDLIGRSFKAFKNCCQHYKGPAIVIRQKKSGLFMCEGDNGEQFESTKKEIVRHLDPVSQGLQYES